MSVWGTCCAECALRLRARHVPGVDGEVCEKNRVVCLKDPEKCDPKRCENCRSFVPNVTYEPAKGKVRE